MDIAASPLLRAVPDSGDTDSGGGDDGTKTDRAKARARAAKALPTDRMKMGVQVKALRCFAVASNSGKEAVTAEALAPIVGVSPGTVALNNNFFLESGLLTREAKGAYKPTAVVMEFNRRWGFGSEAAATVLAPTLRETWYFQALQKLAQVGPVTRTDAIRVLADAAGAGAEHAPNLDNILAWLAFVGLVSVEGDSLALAEDDAAPKPDARDETKPEAPAEEEEQVLGEVSAAPVVLSLKFDLALTAEDLAKLAPEQIHALYEAVGKAMAVKASIA